MQLCSASLGTTQHMLPGYLTHLAAQLARRHAFAAIASQLWPCLQHSMQMPRTSAKYSPQLTVPL